MKKLKNIIALSIFIFGLSAVTNAQCSEENVINSCAKKLLTGFTYLKTYDVDGEAEYSYVFSKGNMYYIQSCSDASLNQKMKITILDRTKHVIASNATKDGISAFLGYKCSATSIYYIRFEVDANSSKECGVGVLGFK